MLSDRARQFTWSGVFRSPVCLDYSEFSGGGSLLLSQITAVRLNKKLFTSGNGGLLPFNAYFFIRGESQVKSDNSEIGVSLADAWSDFVSRGMWMFSSREALNGIPIPLLTPDMPLPPPRPLFPCSSLISPDQIWAYVGCLTALGDVGHFKWFDLYKVGVMKYLHTSIAGNVRSAFTQSRSRCYA